jgi:pyruvate/2-oxoglutarate dehydrogenase complex dihydrolipoamide dehydrogenase (E3) component
MMAINPPTAALLLNEFVALGPGDWVIQNAANSAVGLYLVQLAQYRGFRTVNVVRRQDAAAVVRDVPTGIYSIPEISYVGRTEKDRTEAELPYLAGVAWWRELAKAMMMREEDGY